MPAECLPRPIGRASQSRRWSPERHQPRDRCQVRNGAQPTSQRPGPTLWQPKPREVAPLSHSHRRCNGQRQRLATMAREVSPTMASHRSLDTPSCPNPGSPAPLVPRMPRGRSNGLSYPDLAKVPEPTKSQASQPHATKTSTRHRGGSSLIPTIRIKPILHEDEAITRRHHRLPESRGSCVNHLPVSTSLDIDTSSATEPRVARSSRQANSTDHSS